MCVTFGKTKNVYRITAPFRDRFNGDFESEIGAFIITGDPDTLTYSSYGAGFMAGAAVENACAALSRDCGSYYNTVFTALAAMTGGLGGAYPPPGMGPGSIPNLSVPSSVQSDLGDPDCAGCGYQGSTTPSLANRGNSRGRIDPLNLKEQLAMQQVKSDPLRWGVPRPRIPMTDPRWPASKGWIKYSANINGVEIHFVYNPITNQVDDFKFPIP